MAPYTLGFFFSFLKKKKKISTLRRKIANLEQLLKFAGTLFLEGKADIAVGTEATGWGQYLVRNTTECKTE